MVEPIFTTAAAIITIISGVVNIIKSCKGTIKKLNKIIKKTTDPKLKNMLIQKKWLEEKELKIMKDAKRVLVSLKKIIKKIEKRAGKENVQKELESAEETVKLMSGLEKSIRELKILKKIKLNIQKKVYKKSAEMREAGEHVVDLTKVKKEVLELELMLEKEEFREARLEEFISKLLDKLNQMGKRRSKKLARLLEDFRALSKLSVVERYVDEHIYALVKQEPQRAAA